ncbi:MAG: DUF2865 domain-containing protein [Bradyrhizobiaceae bacterium]|nr:DUF2865 domain-containing protein [Bradyrhizobiaceae bacterium]
MAALAAAAVLAVSAFSGAAEAQGFFDVLRGIFGGHRPPPVERVLPPLPLDGFPGGIEKVPEESGGPAVAYCVRLCDGRYFPLPRNAGAPGSSPEKLCAAMCPAAQTRIFHGDSISRAVAADGRNYSSIEHAFLYREKQVDGCSCTGNGAPGLAALRAEDDPTLRRGDIVVTRDGPKVFAGDPRLPHTADEFKPAENYRGLPKRTRDELSEIRVRRETAGKANASTAGESAEAGDRNIRLNFAPAGTPDSFPRGRR